MVFRLYIERKVSIGKIKIKGGRTIGRTRRSGGKSNTYKAQIVIHSKIEVVLVVVGFLLSFFFSSFHSLFSSFLFPSLVLFFWGGWCC